VVSDLSDRLRVALVDRYTIERELGRGGMAVVYLAEDRRHQRKVALKVLRPELAQSLGGERFLREIQLAAQLNHPHILPLHDSGQTDGVLWYTMPYVEGESLRDRLTREGQLPLDEALRITQEVADGLGYAHTHGVIHRDIKPENILLSDGHAVIADFGIATAVTKAGGERLTETGIAVGTPAYTSPEQASGSRTVDERADLYSLGCVLYEMLSGDPPFGGATPQAVLARQAQERVPSIEIVRPDLPDFVVHVVRRCLAKVPADRFATATELRDAIRARATGEAVPMRRRRARGLILAALVVVLAVAGLWRLGVFAPADLDPRRVMVYALADGGDGGGQGANIAAMIVYALDGLGNLRVLEGGVPPPVAGPMLEAGREDARARGAGFFIAGNVVPHGDSAEVMLTLFDIRGDSVVERTPRWSVPVNETWRAGVRAASELVPYLIPTGGPVDFSAIVDRDLAAVGHFFEGEAHFRRAEYDSAATHFADALDADTLLGIAALRGAEATIWAHRPEWGAVLFLPALERATWSGVRYDEYARGLAHYLSGRADSAVARLRRAMALDSSWAWPWQVVGDVYTHLLPRASPLDSLAEDAFLRAHALDPGFSPILLHLVELAARDSAVPRAESLLVQFRASTTDTVQITMAELMVRCVRERPGAVDWSREAAAHAQAVLNAGYGLAAGGAQLPCAAAAFGAVWGEGAASRGTRFFGLVGLQGVLAAQGRIPALRTLLTDVQGSDMHAQAGMLYVLDALAGLPFADEARAAAAGFRAEFEVGSIASNRLWFLGTWEAAYGDPLEADRIADTLAARAREAVTRAAAEGAGDRLPESVRELQLLAHSVAAHAALARADTVVATRLLSTLDPAGGISAIAWRPWMSLGWERLTLAELRLAAGLPGQAFALAANLAAPAPVIYPLYLRWSLDVRRRAAQALGNAGLASAVAETLDRLGSETD
jgi:hypothetical protein